MHDEEEDDEDGEYLEGDEILVPGQATLPGHPREDIYLRFPWDFEEGDEPAFGTLHDVEEGIPVLGELLLLKICDAPCLIPLLGEESRDGAHYHTVSLDEGACLSDEPRALKSWVSWPSGGKSSPHN